MKKEKENKSSKTAIIICIIIASLLYILPFGIICLLDIFDIDKVKFEQKDGIINIDKFGMKMDITNSHYDEGDLCYYVNTKIDKDKNKKTNKDSMDIVISFKDKDGYILGEGIGSVESISKENKWKISIPFCEPSANQVDSYELKEITSY